MSKTESFESVTSSYDNYTWIGRDGVKRAIDRLKAAHDREIRDVSQQQYDRGFNDGQHSMDAEHRVIAMRLRALPLDGGSHENLSQIARAVYHSDFGWTQGACAALRDKLIDLMGGVSDDTCCCAGGGACAAGDGGDSWEQTEVSDGRADAIGASEDVGRNDVRVDDCDGGDSGESEVTDERLADDCGADTGCGDRGGDLHMAGVRITDELRKWASDRHCKGMSHTDVLNIGLIADRIDAQFDRICWQQEAVLQKTIDGMVKEYEHDRESEQLRIGKLVKQRDAAYACADELSDELLRVRRERDEARDERDTLKRDMLDEWVPRTSYEEKVEKYRRAYMESDAWRKSLQEKLNAMRDAITAALNG